MSVAQKKNILDKEIQTLCLGSGSSTEIFYCKIGQILSCDTWHGTWFCYAKFCSPQRISVNFHKKFEFYFSFPLLIFLLTNINFESQTSVSLIFKGIFSDLVTSLFFIEVAWRHSQVIIELELLEKGFSASITKKVFDSRMDSPEMTIQMTFLQKRRFASRAWKSADFDVVDHVIFQLCKKYV